MKQNNTTELSGYSFNNIYHKKWFNNNHTIVKSQIVRVFPSFFGLNLCLSRFFEKRLVCYCFAKCWAFQDAPKCHRDSYGHSLVRIHLTEHQRTKTTRLSSTTT